MHYHVLWSGPLTDYYLLWLHSRMNANPLLVELGKLLKVEPRLSTLALAARLGVSEPFVATLLKADAIHGL